MAWQPHEDGLRQLAELLKDSLNGADRVKQKRAEETLVQAANTPDYPYYVTYIFTNTATGIPFLTRYAAAVQLKNYIKARAGSMAPAQLDYAKSSVLHALADSNPQLSSFAGTVITEIVQQRGILQWAEVLSELIALVSNTPGNVAQSTQEAAMLALAKVCEDHRKVLDREYSGQRATEVLVPKLLEFADYPNPKIRVQAIKTLRTFITQKSPVLFASLDIYLQKIFGLATDENVEVRRTVCQSLVQLVESQPDLLAPNMDGLVNYILAQQQSSRDVELALDAAEFWLSVADQPVLCQLMQPYLTRVIPVLLAGMVYGEDDIFRLEGDRDDADQEDRAEDIKPQFAQTKAGRGVTTAANGDKASGAPESKTNTEMEEGEVNDEDNSDDDDDWDEEDDPENVWSLRKCSAAALDTLAVRYGGTVFDIVLPYLRENLNHALWPRREAAVLALGAIAEGCLPVVAPHLPELVPFLISRLNDEEPVVRTIACWCLSRYSEWAAQLPTQAETQKYFEPMMEGLLQRMLDRNKKVQEAGASSFASLEEKAGDKLVPYVRPILQQFVLCFDVYKDKNTHILYDCLQVLTESVGAEMAKPELVQLLMPTIIKRWHKIDDQSQELFPLLGCLGYIAAAYGTTFTAFAEPVFERCTRLIYATLQQHMTFTAGQSIDEPDMDFAVAALDLLSAVIQAIDAGTATALIQRSKTPFYDLLTICMESVSDDVRQSAYALLGDCAIYVYPTIEPRLDKVMRIILGQLNLDSIKDENSEAGFNVVINVCWSAGEIAYRAGLAISRYIEPLYDRLMTIINNEEVPDQANENAAVTLGRMGHADPAAMALHLPELAEPFLTSMSRIAATEEKATAFLGFNDMIEKNPAAMEGSLSEYFTAAAQFPLKQQEAEFLAVRQSFNRVIQGYRQMIPNFVTFVSSLPANVQQKLKTAYAL